LHNQVVHCTTSIWEDNNDDFVENDEFYVENINNLDDETEIKFFLSSLESLIHDLFSQKEIIERFENRISISKNMKMDSFTPKV
jgi:hypothetical protein